MSAAARLTPVLTRVVVLAALACGAGTIALLAASDHQDAKAVWAILGPAIGWSFIGTGIYAWRRRPESRSGELMVALGFAWFLSALGFSNSAAVHTISFVIGGLWGGVFLQLVIAFPSGRLAPRARPGARDRGLPDLHRRVDPGDALRRSARPRLRRLPGQPARWSSTTRPWRRSASAS